MDETRSSVWHKCASIILLGGGCSEKVTFSSAFVTVRSRKKTTITVARNSKLFALLDKES